MDPETLPTRLRRVATSFANNNTAIAENLRQHARKLEACTHGALDALSALDEYHHDPVTMASLYDTDAGSGSGVGIWHTRKGWHVATGSGHDPIQVEIMTDAACAARLADVIAASDHIVWQIPDLLATAERTLDGWTVTACDLDAGWMQRYRVSDQTVRAWLLVGLHLDGECLNLDPWADYDKGWHDMRGEPIREGADKPGLIP